MKEVEFVCVNEKFKNATKQEDQDKLFESLKTIKKIIIYKQSFENHNSLAVIINTPSKKEMLKILREIKKISKENNVEIDFTQDVSKEFMAAVKNKTLEYLTEVFKT